MSPTPQPTPKPLSWNYFETDTPKGKDIRIHGFDKNTGEVVVTLHLPPRTPPPST